MCRGDALGRPLKSGGTSKKVAQSCTLSVSQEIVSFREDFQRALDWRGVRMEFRVYAAFAHNLGNGAKSRVNAELHATSRDWLRLCRAVSQNFQSAGHG